MATNKSDENENQPPTPKPDEPKAAKSKKREAADESSTADKKSRLAERQTAAAVKQHDDALKARAAARAEAAGLVTERVVGGPTIQVRTAPGPGGAERKPYVKGGQRFTTAGREVALMELTREQYHAIMTAPLLEVKGKAPKDFEDFRKS